MNLSDRYITILLQKNSRSTKASSDFKKGEAIVSFEDETCPLQVKAHRYVCGNGVCIRAFYDRVGIDMARDN
ncbi:MAG: hypothetical protein J5U17_10515 [Candidatus Methanoperedens sp.]|nr:hypothetical protein [Candidatus Methanoperedens sp.]MCE8428496.1 hypothetical protein [Candidatus Methanoperedens sp.]